MQLLKKKCCLRNFLKLFPFSSEKKKGEKKKKKVSTLLSPNSKAFWFTTPKRKNFSLFYSMLTHLPKLLRYPRKVLPLHHASVLLRGWLYCLLPHMSQPSFSVNRHHVTDNPWRKSGLPERIKEEGNWASTHKRKNSYAECGSWTSVK